MWDETTQVPVWRWRAAKAIVFMHVRVRAMAITNAGTKWDSVIITCPCSCNNILQITDKVGKMILVPTGGAERMKK